MAIETDGQRGTDAAGRTLARRLAGKRLVARTILFLEALTPRLLPAVLLIAGFLALAWFGYFRHVPAWLHGATLLAFAAGLVALLLRLRGLFWPSGEAT